MLTAVTQWGWLGHALGFPEKMPVTTWVPIFLSFDLTPDVSVKQIGLGLAAAMLVDATVARLVLVPAVMEVPGRANWWLPEWLARWLPTAGPDPLRAAGTAWLQANEAAAGTRAVDPAEVR